MSGIIKKVSVKKGLQPGALVHIGDKKVEEVKIEVIDYDAEHFEEKELAEFRETEKYIDESTVTWLNMVGLHDVQFIQKLGEHFGIHRLVLEDVLNTDLRPELDDYEDYIYICLKMLYIEESTGQLLVEQISLILCPKTVLCFQEVEGDAFEPVRERLRNSTGRIRRVGPDYLAYALVDAIVDNYFIVLEEIGDMIIKLEDELMNDPSNETLRKIYAVKREMVMLRKYIWPLRELVLKLQMSESPLIEKGSKIYIQDLYSHALHITDTLETYRDMISDMLDTYLSLSSNKMNEVMKILTIMASIFIPLTFVAGIYGMNFEDMPELHHRWGYPAAIAVMVIIAIGMVYYFRKKKWL